MRWDTCELIGREWGVNLRSGVPVPYLRAWRIKRLMTQEELAARAGVSHNTISAAEHGRRVRLSSVARLARAMRIERADLVERPPEGPDGTGRAGSQP